MTSLLTAVPTGRLRPEGWTFVGTAQHPTSLGGSPLVVHVYACRTDQTAVDGREDPLRAQRAGWAAEVRPRVGWVCRGEVTRRLLAAYATRDGWTLELFSTNTALLDVHEASPYDAVVFHVHDELSAAEARGRAIRRKACAVGLGGSCEHDGGPIGAHGVDPAAFDRRFASSYDRQVIARWLRGLPGRAVML